MLLSMTGTMLASPTLVDCRPLIRLAFAGLGRPLKMRAVADRGEAVTLVHPRLGQRKKKHLSFVYLRRESAVSVDATLANGCELQWTN